ncbi:MAG: Holliday junction branch migration protein RuvA [Chitinophagaceae bacterium]|nr:Holliday junction branch migration protein RuvA [Chitinophagaceae bacterium]
MIAFLSGRYVYKSPAVVHVEVNGVGYEVQVSLNTYSKIQSLEKGTLYTWLHIKEDAHTLYGFFDIAEKNIFLQLISVNGVGTSTARMMLSAMQPNELAQCIANGNAIQLEKIKGIGKKTAERIILELREKMSKTFVGASGSSLINNTLEQDALNALVALGIARNLAENAIKKAASSASPVENLESLIKKALQLI